MTRSIACAAAASVLLAVGACASMAPDAYESEARDAFGRYVAARTAFESSMRGRFLDVELVESSAAAVRERLEEFERAFAAAPSAGWDRAEDAKLAGLGFASEGAAAKRRDDHASAARAFERSLAAEFDPGLVPDLVRQTALAGDCESAADSARRWAAAMKPSYVATAWDALGDVELLRGDRDAAIAAYRSAEAADPHC